MTCVSIIDKWLLPSFNQKYHQTQQKRREPYWFKKFLTEWYNFNSDIMDTNSYTDVEKWVCSCIQFKQSCFYLCKHLVLQSNVTVKFRSQVSIQDSYPFLKFETRTENSASISLPGGNHILSSSPNVTQIVNESANDETSPQDYQQLNDFACFLKQHIEENKHNGRQLAVLRNSLTTALEYQKAVEEHKKEQFIPRTWTDLNKYTMFI